MVQLTAGQIDAIFGSRANAIKQSLKDRGGKALADAGILDSRERLAFFLAQLAHEVGARTSLEENLTYTTAKQLRAVWPRRFPTIESAKPYIRNPRDLANHVYGDRMGNTEPGDGYRYHGRGLIQLTGRDNYRAVGETIGLDLEGQPDLAADPAYVWDVAAGYWTVNRLNRFADRNDFDGLTRAINSGTSSFAVRRQKLADVRLALGTIAGASVGAASDAALDDVFNENVPEPDGLPASSLETETGAEFPFTSPPLIDPYTPIETAAMTIGPNSSKVDVESIQRILKSKGYMVGDVDGIYGTKTTNAVLAFQSDNGLPLTGLVGQLTQQAILTAPDRPIDPERAGATMGDLRRKGSGTVANLDAAKIASALTALLGVFSVRSGEAQPWPTPIAQAQTVVSDIPVAWITAYREFCLNIAAPAKPALCRAAVNAYGSIQQVAADYKAPVSSGDLSDLFQVIGGAVGSAIGGPVAPLATVATGILGYIFAQRAQNRRLRDHRTARNLGH